MLCSVAGAVYDVLGYVLPFITVPHDGMPFSTPYNDHDVLSTVNCARDFGGGWWFTKCSIWSPTTVNPVWYSLADETWYSIESVHMMVKLQ